MKNKIILSFTIIFIILRYTNASDHPSRLTLSLKESLSFALTNNQEIKDAKDNLEVAHRNLIAIYKKYQPNVGLEGIAQKKGNKSSLTSSTERCYSTLLASRCSKITPGSGILTLSHGYNIGFNEIQGAEKFSSNLYISIELNQPLSKGGRLQQRLPFINGDEEFRLANIDYKLTEDKLIFDVINNYYSLIRIKELVKQAEEQINLSQQLLNWTEAKFKKGKISKLDVMNAKLQLSNDENFLIEVKGEEKVLQRKFLQLLGLNETCELFLNEEIKIEFLNRKIDVSINEAIENGLEIEKVKIGVERAKRNIIISQSANKPILTLQGNYRWMNQAKELEETIKALPQRNWAIEANIYFPFFDSGATNNQEKIAEINFRKAQEALEKLKKDTIEEIREIYCELEKARRRIKISEEHIKIAEEVRRITELRYQMGLATIREVLEAQISSHKAKSLSLDAKINYLISQARLFKKIGKLKDVYLQ